MIRASATIAAVAALLAAGCRKAPHGAPAGKAAAPTAMEASFGSLARDSVAQDAAAFVQAFYEWYAEHHNRFEDAVRLRSDVFTPELLRALRADLAASSRAKDDVVGLDWDPFMGGQEPCVPMRVDVVTRRADTLFVAMRGQCTDIPPRAAPDAVPGLVRGARGWAIADIRHGGDLGSLRQDLAELAAQRDSSARRR